MIFEHKAHQVLTFSDVTKLHENQQLQQQNKLIQLVSSSCNHEMLAPIRCIISIASNLIEEIQEHQFINDLTVIYNTSSFLLNQVQSNLDKSLLDQHKLRPKLSEKRLQAEVV